MKFGNYIVSGRAIIFLSGLVVGGTCLGLRSDTKKITQEPSLEQKFSETPSLEKEKFLREHFYDSLREKSQDLVNRTGDVVGYVGRKFETEEVPNYKQHENYNSLRNFFGGKNGKN